ncbi:uncharacterized protein LOC113789996 [Dermatophagoides pteronyssinus]|uniref:uncharacterized protein LOC113789996 n=1 Tax=Dermatophagoides pteronyssinus TaxID=6956 RepID=UPI003F66FDAD
MDNENFGELSQLCERVSEGNIVNKVGPSELLRCCQRLFFCKCIEQNCRNEKRLELFCGRCTYQSDLCDDFSCERFSGEDSCGMASSIAVLVLMSIDIIITIGLIIAACIYERRKSLLKSMGIMTSTIPATSSIKSTIKTKKISLKKQKKNRTPKTKKSTKGTTEDEESSASEKSLSEKRSSTRTSQLLSSKSSTNNKTDRRTLSPNSNGPKILLRFNSKKSLSPKALPPPPIITTGATATYLPANNGGAVPQVFGRLKSRSVSENTEQQDQQQPMADQKPEYEEHLWTEK